MNLTAHSTGGRRYGMVFCPSLGSPLRFSNLIWRHPLGSLVHTPRPPGGKNGQLDVAEQEYKTAISVSKTPARDWLNLASFYGHHNRMPEKQATIQKAVEVDRAGGSKKSKILFEAAISLFHSGDLNGAVELARRYVAAP